MKKKKLIIIMSLFMSTALFGLNVSAEIITPIYYVEDFCDRNTAELHYENELKIEQLYDYVNFVPIYNDGRNPVKEGEFIDVKWTTYQWISYKHLGWSDYEALPKYVYSIYKVGVVDAPYWSDIPKQYYQEYVSEITFTVSQTKSDTYENSLKKTLKNEFAGKLYFGSDFQVGDVVTRTYEEKFMSKHEIVNSIAISEKRKLWADGYYCSQRRATYRMYVVLAFEAEYETTEKIQKVIWHNDKIYSHKKKGYRYKGKSLQFEYTGKCYDALSRYLFDDDGYMYYVPKKDSENYNANFIYL